jgi:hypothetical protein
MRKILVVLAVVAGSAFAHQPAEPNVRADGAVLAEHQKTLPYPDISYSKQVNTDPYMIPRGMASSLQNSEQQRFCIRNYLGKVNCIPISNPGGH